MPRKEPVMRLSLLALTLLAKSWAYEDCLGQWLARSEAWMQASGALTHVYDSNFLNGLEGDEVSDEHLRALYSDATEKILQCSQ
ncbi:unnamed protein product, partial [Polarella glacialis]